jgi:4'-phosphopantetheinyl transferase
MIGTIEKHQTSGQIASFPVWNYPAQTETSMNISDVTFEPGAGWSLLENEVHLWRVYLDKLAVAEKRWRALLSQDEITRADRFHFPTNRQNFTATRALLRVLLGAYIACDPKKVTFLYGEREKPFLAPAHSGGEVEFNVSHSGTRALIAIARGRAVGVDIEQIRDNLDHQALAKRFFSPSEQRALSDLDGSEQCTGFFRCWTRKEAYIKAHGSGLAVPLNAFDVSISSGEENALLATRPDASQAALWSICAIDAGQGYEAALCSKGNNWVLKT